MPGVGMYMPGKDIGIVMDAVHMSVECVVQRLWLSRFAKPVSRWFKLQTFECVFIRFPLVVCWVFEIIISW